MTGQNDFSNMHLDALKEISNIGMGNALTALAQLTNRQINMNVPNAGFYPLEDIIAMIGGEEELVSCITIGVHGDIPGNVMFVFNEKSTYTLVDYLMGLPEGTTSSLDEMGESAVKEVGNVLTGSFINAIATMTRVDMSTTVPVFAFDMLSAVIATIVAASGRAEDNILSIETELFQGDSNIIVSGNFFFLVEPEAVDRLFNALGIN